jgi:inner membrane protein
MGLAKKLVFLLLVIILLLIPLLGFLDSLVDDRKTLRSDVISEIANSFGSGQTILTPVIMLTYRAVTNRDGQYTYRNKYIIPTDVKLSGDIDVDVKKRSIYSVPVYSGNFRLSADFVIPEAQNEFTALDTTYRIYGNGLLSFGVSDKKGLNALPALKVNGVEIIVDDILHNDGFYMLGTPVISLKEGSVINLEASFQLNGTKDLQFAATGMETEVSLGGNWGDPSFNGALLPDDRSVTPEQFNAKWHSTSLSRESFNSKIYDNYLNYEGLGAADVFGVSLVDVVDNYSLMDRAVKYGFLVVVMTFFVIFLLEILLKYRFHLVQYGFTGFALVVFFLLLLSLSEYIGFIAAYIVAAVAQVALIAAYVYVVFKRRATIIFSIFLTALLTFILILLNLREYALLVGSLFVFVALATGMLITRKVDWHNI